MTTPTLNHCHKPRHFASILGLGASTKHSLNLHDENVFGLNEMASIYETFNFQTATITNFKPELIVLHWVIRKTLAPKEGDSSRVLICYLSYNILVVSCLFYSYKTTCCKTLSGLAVLSRHNSLPHWCGLRSRCVLHSRRASRDRLEVSDLTHSRPEVSDLVLLYVLTRDQREQHHPTEAPTLR
jgi:hypothetical protein